RGDSGRGRPGDLPRPRQPRLFRPAGSAGESRLRRQAAELPQDAGEPRNRLRPGPSGDREAFAAHHRQLPDVSARAADGGPARLGRPRAVAGRAFAAGQPLRAADRDPGRTVPGNAGPVAAPRSGKIMAEPNENPDKDDEEARLAAEWAAMADEDATDEPEFPERSDRALNQDEIDSLLGFSSDDHGETEQSGVHAIVNSALVSYERLPMLEVVFDRLVRMMSTSLRNLTSDNVEVSLDSIRSV